MWYLLLPARVAVRDLKASDSPPDICFFFVPFGLVLLFFWQCAHGEARARSERKRPLGNRREPTGGRKREPVGRDRSKRADSGGTDRREIGANKGTYRRQIGANYSVRNVEEQREKSERKSEKQYLTRVGRRGVGDEPTRTDRRGRDNQLIG